MRLLIIRHARAAHPEGIADWQRPLTDEGEREFQAASRWVIQQQATPGHIFHSPTVRTTETARILSHESGLKRRSCEVADWLGLDANCDDILAKLREVPAEVTALVGHEPTMSHLASILTPSLWVKFRPGTIACIEFESVVVPHRGQLLWIIDAAQAEASLNA